MAKRFSQEFRDRGVRLVEAHVEKHECSVSCACRDVAALLGINQHALWVQVKNRRQADAESNHQSSPADAQRRIRQLKAKVKELKRANDFLLEASVFPESTRPSQKEMIAFIDTFRCRFTTAAICRVLNAYRVDGFLSERSYYPAKQRGQSQRTKQDAALLPIIVMVHQQNYSVYGIRTMYAAMQRAGISIGQERLVSLM